MRYSVYMERDREVTFRLKYVSYFWKFSHFLMKTGNSHDLISRFQDCKLNQLKSEFKKEKVYKIKLAVGGLVTQKYLQKRYFLSAEAYRLSVMEEFSTLLYRNGIENAPSYCTEGLMKTKYLLFSLFLF